VKNWKLVAIIAVTVFADVFSAGIGAVAGRVGGRISELLGPRFAKAGVEIMTRLANAAVAIAEKLGPTLERAILQA
jgi:hypothetical protein